MAPRCTSDKGDKTSKCRFWKLARIFVGGAGSDSLLLPFSTLVLPFSTLVLRSSNVSFNLPWLHFWNLLHPLLMQLLLLLPTSTSYSLSCSIMLLLPTYSFSSCSSSGYAAAYFSGATALEGVRWWAPHNSAIAVNVMMPTFASFSSGSFFSGAAALQDGEKMVTPNN